MEDGGSRPRRTGGTGKRSSGRGRRTLHLGRNLKSGIKKSQCPLKPKGRNACTVQKPHESHVEHLSKFTPSTARAQNLCFQRPIA
jgi:hypothetical protein